MAHLDSNRSIRPAAGPAALSAARAALALVAANRSTRGRPPAVPEGDTGSGVGSGTIDWDPRDLPTERDDRSAPGSSPARRRLPTGLY